MNKFLALFIFSTILVIGNVHSNTYSKYFIAVQKKEGFDISKLDSYTELLPPKNSMYADPMLFYHKGINYIFFEDYDYQKGVISYVTVDKNLQITEPRLALELPCHLSFPHVFQEGDEIYMTPETYSLKEVGLYKAIEFPHRWEKIRILVKDAFFADPILFKYNGLFWLFTSASDYSLRVYYATDLMGEFLPHPINRAKIPGRNAGRVYFAKNQLFRPVMDCSHGYGRAMSIKQIIHLTPSRFVEKEVYHIDPNWAEGLDGTHTLNINDDLVVYDGRRTISASEEEKYSKK